MKILIIGDTHGNDAPFLKTIQAAGPFDLLMHTGDSEGYDIIYDAFSPAPIVRIAGNNDFLTTAPYERDLILCGRRIFMTHGHKYDLFDGYERAIQEARRRRADILICGHTHSPVARFEGNLLILNPGSISYPRQDDRRPSYIILTLPEDGSQDPPAFEIRYL